MTKREWFPFAVILIMLVAVNAVPAEAAETRQFRLGYIEADEEVLGIVRQYLGPEGRAVLVNGSNSIIATDTLASIERIGTLVSTLDRRPGQVLIESRIVEVSKSDGRELGINWNAGYSELSGDVLGSPGIVGGSFAVNQPFEVNQRFSEQGGAVLGYGFVTNKHNLNMRLMALEQKGRARIVSSPRVIVMENRRAVISQGEEFVVPKREQSTYINTESPDPSRKPMPETYSAVLKLAVVPRVVEGNDISLALEVRREEFNHDLLVEGYPLKLLKSAMTELLVESGQTAVIGGIKTEGRLERQSGVPLLSRIPILGWLFKGKRKATEESELMIFLTPTILTDVSELPGPSTFTNSTAL